MAISRFTQILVFIFLTRCKQSFQQWIDVVTLHPQNLLDMQFGSGWPHTLRVVEGHQALMKVVGTLSRLESCVVTTPTGIQFDVRSPPSNRYESWSDSCGLRIRSVVESDEGRWRLNATGGGEVIAGWTAVFVTKETTSYTAPEIDLLDGSTHIEVNLTTLDNSYCVVTRPFSDSSLIPGHCLVTLDRATRAVQGHWNVLLGLPGKVQEIRVQRTVTVESERLDVGYVRDNNANKLHLYCDLVNTEKNITFCRFQKTSSSIGYNMVDGLSDGVHSYYGKGFLHRQCGMTIERASSADYGTWRCSVGVQQWAGTHIQQQAPMQALISVGPESSRSRIRSIHRSEEHQTQTVFVQESQTFTVMCRADEALSYCWFQHPNGSSFTPLPIQNEEQPFWYTGENLQVGDCGITFHYATEEESGLWTCHMGPRETLGLEMTDEVEVRVTGPLAANKKTIATRVGDTANLYCHTSNGNRPLQYCRFLSPKAVGFRIDSTVTEDSPILGRYRFMANKSLDYGDCALTISGVTADDLGEWTCAALIHDDSTESFDTIQLYKESREPLSRAGIAGMSIGLSVCVVALIGIGIYKTGWLRRHLGGNPSPQPDDISLNTLSSGSNSPDISTRGGSPDELVITEFGQPSRVPGPNM